jgi:FkbM family methyltransferase
MRLQDLGVFYDVFMTEIYRLPKGYEFSEQNKHIVIWDLGAHIGLTSSYFLSYFSDTRVSLLAVEPYLPNLQLLQSNIAQTDHFTCLHAAVGKMSKQGYLDTTQLAMNNRLGEKDSENQQIGILSFEDLIKNFPSKFIDIMKIDIEGAEFEFLENIESWSVKPSCIMIEFHDHSKSKEMKQRIENMGIQLIEV